MLNLNQNIKYIVTMYIHGVQDIQIGRKREAEQQKEHSNHIFTIGVRTSEV